MTPTQVKKKVDISKLFIFDNFEGGEQKLFLEEVGTLIFQSALMRYLTEKSESEAETFEIFINSNVGLESFVDALCLEYPEFEKILVEEMSAFRSEIIF